MVGKFDNLSALKKWVISNKYFIKTSEPKEKKSEATHFLLDGGIWRIPLEEYQNFLKLLAADLSAGEKHYISENKTNIFKFICDLDFYEDSIISVNQIKHIVSIVKEIVDTYFIDQKIIICGADSKKVVVNEIERIKSGFHLVFPKLWVTVETAKKLRILIIEKLIETFKERENYNKWEDVVDLSVYEDNGLRMVGCRKIGICKLCKNKKETKLTCEKCEGAGKIDENRIYKPVCVLPDNQEYFDTIKNDYYVMLLETSIYNYAHFEETRTVKELNIELPSVSKKSKKNSGKSVQTKDSDSKIENFIRKNFSKEHYSKCCVKKVSKNDKCYYVEIDDNYCMNVDRNHTSSNIYFQIQPTGISQRCFCKKETTDGRLHGPCKEYASKEIPLSKTLKKQLFPDEITVSKKNKSIVTFNITKSHDKETHLNNCKSLLFQLKHELL
jgi:hypothetical protein